MHEESLPPPFIARLVLITTILGSSMAFLDSTVVNLTLPTLQKVFHANVQSAQWVVEAYALTLTSLLLVGGSMGDRCGQKKMYLYGIIVFALSSVACGLAPDMALLIGMRAMQGIGAALLVPGSLALITATFPERERGSAIGIWSGFSAITAAVGPVAGGWLIEHFSWRWVFFLNIPFALVVILLCRKIPEARNKVLTGRLDWVGAVLTTIGLGAVTYALVECSSGTSHAVLEIVGLTGVLALGMFLWCEKRASAPMLPFVLFRSHDFTCANLLTFFVYAPLGALLFFTPLDLIQIQHYSTTKAGAAFSPFILTMLLLSRWAGRLVDRYGPRLPLTVGPLITAVGFGLFAMASQDGDYWTSFFPAVLVMSFGMTITVAPLTTAVMNAVPESKAGVASGINNAVSRFASLMAVAALGAFLVSVFVRTLDRRLASLALSPELLAQIQTNRLQLAGIQIADGRAAAAVSVSFVHAYRSVLWVSAVLLLLAAGLGSFGMSSGRNKAASRSNN